CRLRWISEDQRRWLETEHVADHPDVELRILTPPGGRPELAEIVFPPAMPIDQAKQFVFQELQEVTAEAKARSLRWVEEDDRLILGLSDRLLPHDQVVALGAGIREILRRVEPRPGDRETGRQADTKTPSVSLSP